jgi:4-amino-4-deoxy-L-arabinose transferase-like glycosyltransferase
MIDADDPKPPMAPSVRLAAREWTMVVCLILAGLAARVWQFSTIGLNQFDEGAYAFSALGFSDSSQPLHLFPLQIRFSPPVYYGIVGMCFKALGRPSDQAAIAVNIALGTLTILLVWRVGRAWFGRGAGTAAAVLLALNEFHVAFSRAALTDVCFALAFLAALALTAAALQYESAGLSVVAGLAVGLAWNTKYHGWFALLIGAGAVVAVQWRRGWSRTSSPRPILLLGLIAVVAVACYLPWTLFIQSEPGGYAGLAAYQRTLLDRHWFQNLLRQAEMQFYFEGPLSRCAPAVAVIVCGFTTGVLFQPSRRFLLVLVGAAISGLVLGSAGTALLLTLAAVPHLIRRSDYAGWILAGWLGLWFAVTPLYHPYARLVLPFTIATHLGAGLWLMTVLRGPARTVSRRSLMPAGAGAVMVAVVFILSSWRTDHSLWRPSRSLADAARAIESVIPPGQRVSVIGEPSLAFYLHLSGRPSFEREVRPDDLARLTTRAYVVTGVYARRAPVVREGLRALGDQLVPLASYHLRPNDVRLLDDLRPSQARAYVSHPDDTFDLTLFQFVPKVPDHR